MSFEDRLEYVRATFCAETPELRRARESAAGVNDQIFIRPEDGRLLQLLIRMAGVRHVVEIGALCGYSALWMAGALPPDGTIVTLEKDPARAAAARENLRHDPRISLVEGDALQTLETLPSPCDMVFIDADKVNYLRYLDWAEKNVRRGGLIVGDNTFLFDAVWRDAPVDNVRATARQAMRDFNARLADTGKYAGLLLPTTQGMTVAVRL